MGKRGLVYNEGDMLQLIRAKFQEPEYAVLYKVTDGTGSNYSRICDAIAVNLWPSRGNAVHGFEVKVSRTDWTRELKNPAKADAIACYCDYWWIVAPEGIVQDGELPPTWGLLCPFGRGLKIYAKAPKLNAQPLDKLFISAMLRRATEDMVPKSNIAAELHAKYVEGQAAAERHAEAHADAHAKANKIQLERLTKALADFELQSGVKIGEWDAGRIGHAVNCVLSCRYQRDRLVNLMHEAKNHAEAMTRVAASIAKTLAENPEL